MNLRESFALRGIAFHQVGIPDPADNSHLLAVGDVLDLFLGYGVSDDYMATPVFLQRNRWNILFGIIVRSLGCGVIRPSFLMRRFEELRIIARRACRWVLIQRRFLCRRRPLFGEPRSFARRRCRWGLIQRRILWLRSRASAIARVTIGSQLPAGSQLCATPLLAFQELIVACLRKQWPAVGCEAA